MTIRSRVVSSMGVSCWLVGVSMVFGLMLPAATSSAGSIDTTFPFELDTWFDINHEDGSVTIHRVRVAALEANIKSRVFRPGLKADPMVQDVQIQVEYSNSSKKDVEAELEIYWVDAKGRRIDGYKGNEDANGDESHERMTAARSTLVYGIEMASKLEVKIRF